MDLDERLNANELGVRISTRKGRGTADQGPMRPRISSFMPRSAREDAGLEGGIVVRIGLTLQAYRPK